MKAFNLSAGILVCLFLPLPCLSAQNAPPTAVPEPEARQHITQKVDPVYPPIARAAQVQGEVVLSVVIGADGNISSEKASSGPPMLLQAALDAVKKWQFTPFMLNGNSISVATTLTIPFHLDIPELTPEQDKAAQAWFPLSNQCRSDLKAQKASDALDSCKKMLDMSMKAGDLTSSDQLARLDSHELYGHALLMAGNAQDALSEENLAFVEALKCVTDKDQEYAGPLFWRAIAEANLGKDDAALNDFLAAESTLRHAIANLPDMKKNYDQYQAAVLKQHAALLDRMGKTAEADKMRADAAAL
jgi:TonB family protein